MLKLKTIALFVDACMHAPRNMVFVEPEVTFEYRIGSGNQTISADFSLTYEPSYCTTTIYFESTSVSSNSDGTIDWTYGPDIAFDTYIFYSLGGQQAPMSVLATETSLAGTSVIVYRYATGLYYSTPTPQQVTINFIGDCPTTLT